MDSLVTTAIVGTGQQSPEKIATGTPIDTLATQLPAENTERALLLTAGAQAVYRQAGYRAAQAPATSPPAPEETLRACTKEAAYLLDILLKGQYEQLLPEALERLQDASLRIPHELLPQALKYGTEHKQIREALFPVLGERGRWLSQFNTSWTWVQQFLPETSKELPADTETIWQEGTIGQRSEILRRARAINPAKAREWLEEVWKQEKAEARNALLTAMEINLTADDEAFLETALDDRSATVKAGVVSLLARIPSSALGQRMQERADAMLTFEKGKLKKGKFVLQPPQKIDEQWKRDGLHADAVKRREIFQQELERIVALIPPSHWTERFAATPATLLDALKGMDEKNTLLDAWSQATCLHRDQQWVGSLLERQLRTDDSSAVSDLLALLTQQEAEQQLAQLSFDDEDQTTLLEILPRPWSQEFGEICLTKIRGRLEELKKKKNIYYYQFRLLNTIAVALPLACIEQAQQIEELREEEAKDWSLNYLNEKLTNFIETLKMRKRIVEEIRP